MIAGLALALLLQPPICGDWPAERSTAEVREDARERVRRTCRALGASAEACEVLDVMVVRESSGDPCAVHTLGEGEYGLGVLGLSCRWHARSWDGRCESLRTPEIAAVVGLRIYRRAVSHHEAVTWASVNEVFATGGTRRSRPRAVERWCSRLAARGIDCLADPRGQLGDLLGARRTPDQEATLTRALGDG